MRGFLIASSAELLLNCWIEPLDGNPPNNQCSIFTFFGTLVLFIRLQIMTLHLKPSIYTSITYTKQPPLDSTMATAFSLM